MSKARKIELVETSTDDGHYNLTLIVEADYSEEFLYTTSGLNPHKDSELEDILSMAEDQSYVNLNEEDLLKILYRKLPNQEILDYDCIEIDSQISRQTPQTYEEALQASKSRFITVDIRIPIKANYSLEMAIEKCVIEVLEK